MNLYQKAILVALAMLCVHSADAVGDLPTKLTRQQAGEAYRTVQPLLKAEALTCPEKAPVSGMVTGGATPNSGSQKTILRFDRGATVTILRSWTKPLDGPVSVSVSVDCKPAGVKER